MLPFLSFFLSYLEKFEIKLCLHEMLLEIKTKLGVKIKQSLRIWQALKLEAVELSLNHWNNDKRPTDNNVTTLLLSRIWH